MMRGFPHRKSHPKFTETLGLTFLWECGKFFQQPHPSSKRRKVKRMCLGVSTCLKKNEKNAHVFQQQPKKNTEVQSFFHHQISDDIFIAEKATSEFPPPESFAASSALHSLSSADLPVVCDSSSHQITMMKLIQIAQKNHIQMQSQGFPPRFKWSSRIQNERLSPIYP